MQYNECGAVKMYTMQNIAVICGVVPIRNQSRSRSETEIRHIGPQINCS